MSEVRRLLRFLRRVQQQLAQTDRWIAEEEQRAAAAARAKRRVPPKDPCFVISHGIGTDRKPFEVHVVREDFLRLCAQEGGLPQFRGGLFAEPVDGAGRAVRDVAVLV